MSYNVTSNSSVDTAITSIATSMNSEALYREGGIKNNDNLVSMFDVTNIQVIRDLSASNGHEAHDVKVSAREVDEFDADEHSVGSNSRGIIQQDPQNSEYYSDSSSNISDLIETKQEDFTQLGLKQANLDRKGPDNASFRSETEGTLKLTDKREDSAIKNASTAESDTPQTEIGADKLAAQKSVGFIENKPFGEDALATNETDNNDCIVPKDPVTPVRQEKRDENDEENVARNQKLHFQNSLHDENPIENQLSQSLYSRKYSTVSRKSQKKSSTSSTASNDGQKMIFEKRKISLKPRTPSIQSVLSNVSSRNVLSRHSTHEDASAYATGEKPQLNPSNPNIPNGPIYDMMFNPSQQVQSPAMMTNLKKVRSNIQLGNAHQNSQATGLTSTFSNGHTRQHSISSNISNNNYSSTNLAGLRGSYETEKVLIGERVPFVSRDGDSDALDSSRNDESKNNNSRNNDALKLTKKPSAKHNQERNFSNTDDIINNDLIEWKNGSVTSMVSGTLTTYKPNRFNNNTSSSKTGNRTSNGSEVIEDDASDSESITEKKLTTDALKKLNLLQQQKKNRRKASMISQTSTNSSMDSPTRLRSYNSFTKRDTINEEQKLSVDQLVEEEDCDDYEDTFGKDISSLSFFGKNIIMDSTMVPRKHSIVPVKTVASESSNFLSKKSSIPSENKKKQQQIDIPKKPLYTPAVLRDIKETKISNDVLLKRALSPSLGNSNNSKSQQNMSAASSYLERTSVKTTETSTSTWSKLRNLFNTNPSSSDLCQTTTASFVTPKQEPITKKHWIPDDERSSCFDCSTKFNLFERRHHCRHCGEIFCFRHLRHFLYLNSQAHFIIGATGLGRLAKVCDSCLDKYEGLLLTGNGGISVEEEEGGQPSGNNNGANSGIDRALPEDWYWSSF